MGERATGAVVPNDLARVVADRLRVLRDTEGLTETAVAARCVPPVKQTYLAKVVGRAVHVPPPERLAALAVGLALPLRDLQVAVETPPLDPDSPLPQTFAEAASLSALGDVAADIIRQKDAQFALELRRVAEEERRRQRGR